MGVTKTNSSQIIVNNGISNMKSNELNGEQYSSEVISHKRSSSLLEDKSSGYNGDIKAKTLKMNEVSGVSSNLDAASNHNQKRLNDSSSSALNLLGNQTVQQSTQSQSTVLMHPILEDPNTLHQILDEEVTFSQGEFLIHKSTFTGNFENYDVWCVLDESYLQKYEPVLLASGERCHQSADVVSKLKKMKYHN